MGLGAILQSCLNRARHVLQLSARFKSEINDIRSAIQRQLAMQLPATARDRCQSRFMQKSVCQARCLFISIPTVLSGR